jgi:hypothetical protein
MVESSLRLTYIGLTEQDMLDILLHYQDTQGIYLSFALPANTLSGLAAADYTLTGFSWRYATPPTVLDLPCDRYTVEVELESVESKAALISVGLRSRIGLSVQPGIAAAANGIDAEIGFTLEQGAFEIAGIQESLAITLDGGTATGEGAADGLTQSIGVLLDSDGVAVANGINKTIAASIDPGAASGLNYEVFLSSGTWDWTAAGSPGTVDVLLVGGGGGGGSRSGGGGGGAGGLRVLENVSVTANVTVTVGAGGAGASSAVSGGDAGSDGAASLFGAESAAGGGGGGRARLDVNPDADGRAGGSGGGGGRQDAGVSSGGAASPSGQGNAGGIGGGGNDFGGGGGGGAGGAGGDRQPADSGLGGVGGIGVLLDSLGWTPGSGPATVSIGGQGGKVGASLAGGQGGGGSTPTDQNGSDGAANTGGGGGGGGSLPGSVFGSGGSGGSGLVIVRWST